MQTHPWSPGQKADLDAQLFFFFFNSLSCLALDTEMLKLVGSISVSRDLGGNGQNIEGNE